jgi:hypothetical protein
MEEPLREDMILSIQDTLFLAMHYLYGKDVFNVREFFDDTFDTVGTGHIADTRDKNVIRALNKVGKPSLTLTECDVTMFVPKQEVYLVDVHALGIIREIDEVNKTCTVEITAVSFDKDGYRCPFKDVIQMRGLDALKHEWSTMYDPQGTLKDCLGRETAVAVYTGSKLPHDYANDTADILNLDLLHLLFNAFDFYTDLVTTDPHIPAFQFISGPPGCGKTTTMLQQIDDFPGRKVLAAHSNLLEKELHDRMIQRSGRFLTMFILFLGPTFRGADLPEGWYAWSPFHLGDEQIESIVMAAEILVIGTVKKIDDLRKICKQYLAKKSNDIAASEGPLINTLRFQMVLHDEFARQHWLELYSMAKVCDEYGEYKAYGDPGQTKGIIDNQIYQSPEETSEDTMVGWSAGMSIQKDFWDEYLRWKKSKGKEQDGLYAQLLTAALESSASLNVNRRSHPCIVQAFSKAYYANRMKPSPEFTEPSFSLAQLAERVIFIHCDSSSPAAQAHQKSYRNDEELTATKQLTLKLIACGINPDEIMPLSAYSLHADRMQGRTVASAQGSENTVVIYNVVAYGQASDTQGKLSLRGDVFNTAGTRAKSLFLCVANVHEIIRKVKKDTGLRKILSWSPTIPLTDFLDTLPDVAKLNRLLVTDFKSKKAHLSDEIGTKTGIKRKLPYLS